MKSFNMMFMDLFQVRFGNLLHLIVFALYVSVSTSSCSSGNSKDQGKDQPVSIPVLELQTMNIEVPKTYICDIQAVQFVEVRSKVEGFVDKIFVDEGEYVEKGQMLFQLSSMEFNEMVNSANAKMMQAKAESNAATVEVERLRTLVQKNIISPSELELAKSKKAVAESAILEAESILKNAKTGLSYAAIRAPFDGIVDRIPYKTGSLVTAGDLLTNITDISEVFAYYKINENEYLQYMREQEEDDSVGFQEDITLILSDGVEYPYKGKLETMEADFETGTGSIAFRVRFPNPDQLLKHGASGKVEMQTKLDGIYLIPQKSTFEIQDYNYVYMVNKNNKVVVRSFKPLQRFGVYYIADGFEPGDRIVFEGIQQVKDGLVIDPGEVAFEDAYDSLARSI